MGTFAALASFVVALATLIAIHEAGHFLAARWCGVKVLRFSIGFGRPLLIWRSGRDQMEWVIAAFPLGGYVKMLDEGEGIVPLAERHRAFNRKPLWSRAAIVAAGPFANFLFAIVLYIALGMNGSQQPRPILGAPDSGSLAAAAGIKANDEVLKVNGKEIKTWQELRWGMLQSGVNQTKSHLSIRGGDNSLRDAWIDFKDYVLPDDQTDPIAKIGLHLYRPPLPAVIGKLTANGGGERAGLQVGDRVVRANGREVLEWADFVDVVRSNPGQPVVIEVAREGGALTLTAVPEAVPHPAASGLSIGRIGAAPRPYGDEANRYLIAVSLGPLAALQEGIQRTAETAWFSLRMLVRMIAGELSWKNLSGPVTIAEYAGQSAQLGIEPFLSFLALISISLGVLNLLPIPLLDGGHLLYYAIEFIKGRPLSDRWLELGQKVGFSIIILVTSLAVFNDLKRVFFS